MSKGNYHFRIRDLAIEDRPRERLTKFGAGSLTSAELIAILLRVGVKGESAIQVGQRLLNSFGGLVGIHKASIDEVPSQHGMGNAKTATIKGAIELGRRLSITAPDEKPVISSPADAAALVQYEMSALEQEHFRVMLLNTRNQVMDIVDLYHGSLNSSTIRVGEVFKHAIRKNATAIVAIHNHPSGDPKPSEEDVLVTQAIVSAGKLLDIEVLDQLIIGLGAHVSLREKNLGFD